MQCKAKSVIAPNTCLNLIDTEWSVVDQSVGRVGTHRTVSEQSLESNVVTDRKLRATTLGRGSGKHNQTTVSVCRCQCHSWFVIFEIPECTCMFQAFFFFFHTREIPV